MAIIHHDFAYGRRFAIERNGRVITDWYKHRSVVESMIALSLV